MLNYDSNAPRSQAGLQVVTEVREYVLDNGLTVWVNEDHSQPKVFGAVVVKAGARDTPNTGIAHYFEHMMFKGTDKIGTVDYAAEKVLLDAIVLKYDELAKASDGAVRRRLQAEINELSVRAADYVIPNEFDKLITKYGGTKLNAGTSHDYTVYHNVFSPQYFEQWAEINSERLLNPVFRMFQSELETVYEEKNRSNDMMLNQAVERLMEIYFHPHPYAYSIIGSADNLKNPRLSEMRKFFEDYYVGSYMGLILSGDFDTERILPLLDRTFGRIPKGGLKLRQTVKLPPFQGREKATIRIPMPLLKAVAIAFRGIPANHPDQPALDVAVGLLNNANGTGILDQLMANRDVMGAMAGKESFNEAGYLGIVVVPRLVSNLFARSAERKIWNALKVLKKGQFADSLFNSLKQERLRQHLSELEDIDSRSQVMVRLFAQGRSWDDYREDLRRAEAMTKDDVVRVANKYFGDNYLYVKKKTGRYHRTVLPKSTFAPILPKHTDSTSAYARKLEEIPVRRVEPRFLNFDRDVQRLQLTPLSTLYVAPNRVNNIFTFTLSFGIGLLEAPRLKYLSAYLSLLGTGNLPCDVLRLQLQTLGSTLDFDAGKNDFTVKITGFDRAFGQTLAIVCDFMKKVSPDDRKLKTIVDDAKVTEKTFFKANNEVAHALFEYVQYGAQSEYLQKPSLDEVKRMTGLSLINLFGEVQQVACTLHYCGTLAAEEVAGLVRAHVRLDAISRPSNAPLQRAFMTYDRPQIFFYDIPHVFQNIIYAYMTSDPVVTPAERCRADLFSKYFGDENMSSVMFQEIREFRSYAYYTSGAFRLPPLNRPETLSRFVGYLSTQCDKTAEALQLLNSLICNMPEHPERIDDVVQTTINQTHNDYPAFRDISFKIASLQQEGYTEDPNRLLLQQLSRMTMDDIRSFYEAYVKGRNLVYVVVGHLDRMEMKALSAIGEVVRMKKQQFYR